MSRKTMLRRMNWQMWLGELISLTAAIVLIAVSVLSFNIGMAHQEEAQAEPKQPPPIIEEEFNIPDPCAELGFGWAFVRNEAPQAQEKKCGSEESSPAKAVEPLDPCGWNVLAHNAETMDLDEACELDYRDI